MVNFYVAYRENSGWNLIVILTYKSFVMFGYKGDKLSAIVSRELGLPWQGWLTPRIKVRFQSGNPRNGYHK